MKYKAIVQTVTRSANRFGLHVRKHSPEILLVGGIIGAVGGAIMACKATTKLDTVLDKAKNDIDAIHQAKEDGYICVENKDTGEIVETECTDEVYKRHLCVTYVRTGLDLAKLYAPSIIVGGLSITSILASNNILRQRNVALAAAYATMEKSYERYRKNVLDRFGEKVDRELRYGIKTKEYEETEVNEKTGKEKTVKKKVDVVDERLASPYARFFDVGNKYWEKDANYNFMFLRSEQNYANDKLRADGHLFLNDVLVRLGFDKVPEGQIVGWLYDPDSENSGDNYVDFGIYDMNRERVREFALGHERTIILDFNVDGDIWKKMNDPKYRTKFKNA